MSHKRLSFLLPVIFLIAEASIITFNPSRAKGKVGEIRTFTIDVKHYHFPCLIDIDDGEFSYEKVSLISASQWESLGPGRFRRILTVRLKEEGKGKIRFLLVCPIKKSLGEVSIDITKRTFEETYEEAKRLLADLLIGKDVNLSYLKGTLKELIADSAKAKSKEAKAFLEKAKGIVSAIEKILTLSEEAIERK